MTEEKIIGVIAGAGPFAGQDLMQKILDQTIAHQDQDHLTIASLSQPNQILDRTAYLLGEVSTNPAYAFSRQLLILEQMGAAVAGIPCNTAHAPAIFDILYATLQASGSQLTLLHMIREVAHFLKQHAPHIHHIGVLSTTGTYQAQIYPTFLEPAGFTVLVPEITLQKTAVHPAIYHPDYGIKSCGTVTPTARENLLNAIHHLRQRGAEAIILGCTEIPLAITEQTIDNIPMIDPTLILARALIREANPAKLKPLRSIFPCPESAN